MIVYWFFLWFGNSVIICCDSHLGWENNKINYQTWNRMKNTYIYTVHTATYIYDIRFKSYIRLNSDRQTDYIEGRQAKGDLPRNITILCQTESHSDIMRRISCHESTMTFRKLWLKIICQDGNVLCDNYYHYWYYYYCYCISPFLWQRW